jgi:hypothetical protein
VQQLHMCPLRTCLLVCKTLKAMPHVHTLVECVHSPRIEHVLTSHVWCTICTACQVAQQLWLLLWLVAYCTTLMMSL